MTIAEHPLSPFKAAARAGAFVSLSLLSLTSLTSLAVTAPGAKAETPQCAELRRGFDEALRKRDLKALDRLGRDVDVKCPEIETGLGKRMEAELVAEADSLKGRPEQEARREELLLAAAKDGHHWRATLALGRLRMDQGDYARAQTLFEETIDIMENRDDTPDAPGESEAQDVTHRLDEARTLLASQNGQFDMARIDMARMQKDIKRSHVRGAIIRSVPVPITFDTDSAELTPSGQKFAAALSQAIKEKLKEDPGMTEVWLTGHTDETGSDEYNMKLSKRRVETVRRFLEADSVGVKIVAIGLGKREQFTPSKDLNLNHEQVLSLNRRVTWRKADSRDEILRLSQRAAQPKAN